MITRYGICLKHHRRFTCKDMFTKGSERKIIFIRHAKGAEGRALTRMNPGPPQERRRQIHLWDQSNLCVESVNPPYVRSIDAHKAKRSREPVMLETAIVLVLNGIGSCSDMSRPSCKFCKIAAYPGLTSNLLVGRETTVVTHLHSCV